jgi:DNA modification methylase
MATGLVERRKAIPAEGDARTLSSPVVRMIRVDDLVPYVRNARTHSAQQVAQIAASIREFGWTNPILVDGGNGVIAGHGRLQAARKRGLVEVPVIELAHLSETQKRAYVIADNRLAEAAGWDDDLLRVELADLREDGFDLGLTGFDPTEIDTLLAPGADDSAGADEAADDVPESVAEPAVRAGDLWLLGGHRLLCGDSTDPAVVARLMAGDAATLCFTSPPYGQQRAYTTGGISDWDALMQGVFATLPMTPDGQVLVNLGLIHRDNEWQPYWQGWLEWMASRAWRRFGWYVWDQGPGLPGDWNGRLAPSFEFVFHFNRQSRRPNKIIPCVWAGHVNPEKGGLRAKDGTVGEWTHAGQGVQDMRIPDNVLRVSRHKARGIETAHPAVFPTALPAFVMNAYSDEGDVIYEPFSGSGSTIIAGQQTGRQVRAIELAPAYVDVALRRFRLLYPTVPVTLDGDGRSYEAVIAERQQEITSC